MLCRACLLGRARARAGVRAGARAAGSRAGADDGSGSPLRRLLDEAGAFGEASPPAGELRWATQPYASGPPRAEGGAERTAPEETSVVLFPGQGSAHVGMGRRLERVPPARDLYELASSVVGWDVWKVCTEGPAEELARREQECVAVTALAALEAAREARPAAVGRARAAAGFSLGEFAALVFAGALPLDAALRVLAVRAAAMRACAAAAPGGMLAVWLAPDADLPALLRAATGGAAGRVCAVANYLYPGCKVLAGDLQALQYVERSGAALGVRRSARVRVAGAFHCALMAGAQAPVAAALRALRAAVRAPRLTVYSCAEARPYRDAAHVARALPRLAAAPVRWEQTLHALYARPRSLAQPLTLVLGPGGALRGTLRQVNARAWDASLQIDV